VKGSGNIILAGDPARHYHNSQYAVFLQDDWRVKPRLTVNLGLRYELATVLTDRDNKLGNFDPVRGLVQVGRGETSAFHGDHNNVSPRLGFAWDVRGNGKTVVRGGGSIMYEQLPFSLFTAVANALGLNQVPREPRLSWAALRHRVPATWGCLARTWPAVSSHRVGGSNPTMCIRRDNSLRQHLPRHHFALQCGDGVGTDPGPCNTEAVDPNLRTPYVSTWTLTIQRAFTNDLSLEVAYVGNHGLSSWASLTSTNHLWALDGETKQPLELRLSFALQAPVM